MSDPFFAAPKPKRKNFGGDKGAKRNRPSGPSNKPQKPAAPTHQKRPGKNVTAPKKPTEKLGLDEELSEGDSDVSGSGDSGEESDESIKENADEKRLRLAKQYIQNLKEGMRKHLGGIHA